ncbi:GNAT family N-acetyltransferase [Saccharomonospora xinjiangensis]|uniref:Putative acetyltransferase n=1 Tax=Saccharomonospora xinjiangensis XJ-54 TaxID=882086 RepID=I0V7X7_9PSEU|nr:GNAT family N-acetyltransferase [Saccharomonospora xinjiangensis]EID56230.1 putative acetyltransferase [Saccharomonospora xinjiangensis XJ-54]
MNDVSVRALREDEFRAAHTLFRAALHTGPATDERWERVHSVYQPGSALGAFDDELIGTVRSTDAELVVPGGARVPMAAVTGVGVRADRTRRGVLTALMRHQLTTFADRGVVAAVLYATEGVIYGRYGYGIASRYRKCTVDTRRAQLRLSVPQGGRIELLSLDEAERRLPELYASLPLRPGMITRTERWWPGFLAQVRNWDKPAVTVVHHGPDGPDGFAIYRVDRDPDSGGTMLVEDLHFADAAAFAGLWRFLLSVDLVERITLSYRGLEEPLELLFTDPRACATKEVLDETWLRLVDVEAALAARPWRGEALVLEVTDAVLDRNTGRYRIGSDGVRRTEEEPDAVLDVDTLSMIYSGGWRPSTLVDAGRITVREPGTAARLDECARTPSLPWCGTFF